ncbi:DUF1428 domain-containing protein [Methylosinus sp. PW1]|uniref:DUF1428 domain-containing protein n=1 Tax=Methylosinus sp. PW1 TaxID=107636 RepID=UPI0005635545|nr:DUF1428 domain-containing protein [Methylosinus sp. PW1]
MSYVDGYVIPVPAENKDVYKKMALRAWPVFKEFGAMHLVECWGDDIHDGKLTDFKRAVAAQSGEQVVFSWVVWPSKDVRDAAHKKIFEDPRMKSLGDMPFDGKRMIIGGFDILVEESAG